jgi:hypothetical protein
MSATADLLASLDVITHEATIMLRAAESYEVSPADRRELKRRVLAIRGQAQEIFDWLSESRLEEPRN